MLKQLFLSEYRTEEREAFHPSTQFTHPFIINLDATQRQNYAQLAILSVFLLSKAISRPIPFHHDSREVWVVEEKWSSR